MTLPKKILVSFLHDILRIRLVEEKIAEVYPEGEIRCPVHLCIGQEAIPVGVSANLKKSDLVLSNHRAHGHYLAKGGNLKKMFAEMYGKTSGCSKGRGGSMHLIDLGVNFLGSTPIVGSTIPIATGVAFAEKMKGRKSVTVSFFGDAAVEEGVFHESVNFAVLKRLPILFVCENNLYSVYTHLRERQPPREIYRLVAGHGIPSFKEDGNDVARVYEMTKKVLKNVRAGKGPAFIEFSTYRWREHCGPNYDDNFGYRGKGEFAKWQTKCPIRRLSNFLLSRGLIAEKELAGFKRKIQKEAEGAVLFAKKSPAGKTRLALEDVYA